MFTGSINIRTSSSRIITERSELNNKNNDDKKPEVKEQSSVSETEKPEIQVETLEIQVEKKEPEPAVTTDIPPSRAPPKPPAKERVPPPIPPKLKDEGKYLDI